MTIVITGNDLRARRKARGLSQDALGDLLDVTGSAVSQWEREVTTPSWQQAQKLEEIFEGVTPAESTRVDEMAARLAELVNEVAALRVVATPTPHPIEDQLADLAGQVIQLASGMEMLRDELRTLRRLLPAEDRPTDTPAQQRAPQEC